MPLKSIYDSLSLDLESIDIPRPKVRDVDVIIKALIIKEFEGHSLRSAEIRVDHAVLHFWEKKLSDYVEVILNRILVNLEHADYSKTFVDSTIFTHKKEIDQKYKQ